MAEIQLMFSKETEEQVRATLRDLGGYEMSEHDHRIAIKDPFRRFAPYPPDLFGVGVKCIFPGGSDEAELISLHFSGCSVRQQEQILLRLFGEANIGAERKAALIADLQDVEMSQRKVI